MLKGWHREDIAAALRLRRWTGPEKSTPRNYFEGERLHFFRGGSVLTVSFLADVGYGYTGPKSLEEAGGSIGDDEGERLWLHRRLDAKWRSELVAWADAVSTVQSV